jgi:carboxyl-terminal processing protease
MSTLKNKKLALGILVFLIACGIFIFGFLVGHGQLKLEEGYKPKLINRSLGKPKDVDFALFWNVWNKIDKQYLNKIDKQKMVYGAIKGMVAAIDDPYSVFMDPTETKEFNQELEGKFSGIGAEVGVREGKLVIIAPLPGSPAEKSGLQPGDIIVSIDGESADLFTVDQAVTKIRGKAGTTVLLIISREGAFQNKEFKIVREDIQVPSAKIEMKGKIVYIDILLFNEETAGLVKKFIEEAKDKNAQGLIIDVRNNPGGYLDSAVEICDFFVMKGKVIVSEKYKNDRQDEYKATIEPIVDLPLIVLINDGSASASEIFAGAIKDYHLGTLIGEKTFGKGTVQDFEQFPDSSSLRLTIAHWLTPGGTDISKAGIAPDIQVGLSDEDANVGRDPQLQRALQELK